MGSIVIVKAERSSFLYIHRQLWLGSLVNNATLTPFPLTSHTMLAIGIQSASAMSAPIRGFDKCFMFNRLDIAKIPRCEWFRHTHRGVQLACGPGISLRNPTERWSLTRTKQAPSSLPWRT